MRKITFTTLVLLTLLTFLVIPGVSVQAQDSDLTSIIYSLIDQTNSVRAGYGLSPLTTDSILMYTAQWTAETMASLDTCAHLSTLGYASVSSRVSGAGYGNGATVFATENMACGLSSDNIYSGIWNDYWHLLPVNGTYAYRDVGAGAARSASGTIYYVLHAAYIAGGVSNNGGTYSITTAPTAANNLTRTAQAGATVSNYINAVYTSTPQPDGSIIHVVQPGQTFWSIAIAYDTHIIDIQNMNQLPTDSVLWVGQSLVVRGTNTPGAEFTPTETPIPPTRTATLNLPTRTPTQYQTRTPTVTPTLEPVFPGFALDRRAFGILIITICALGLGAVMISSFRKKS
ncbi:MAG TPA: LysM peptidoglycan-binding domain-containing protein [Longilinea sp.]|nr:LysM peptidoglycan-binding domain-containing protein [Longilinea sp.]